MWETMEDSTFGPSQAKPDAGRITIPARYCKRIPWLCEDKAMSVWLLMLQPGRFRLLSDKEAAGDGEIGLIRSLIVDGPQPADSSPAIFEAAERAARLGRLIPTTLSPSSTSGWRLAVPKTITSKEDPFVLLFSLGRLEIWLSEAYIAALEFPLSAIL
jgi:hypothetical protein